MTDPNVSALEDTIIACERKVWDALVAGDARADAAALANDFLGVYPDGFAGKGDHVGQLANGPSVLNYALANEHLLELADGVVLLSYLARFQRTGRDAQEAMYVSSIWKRDSGTWKNIFSQDTPA